MRSPLTSVTVPSPSARTTSPASRAARPSIPVPTYGASVTTSGTACFCMLAPMSARLASSCSTNGMRAVETEMICFGLTSISSTSAPGTKSISDVVPNEVLAAPTRMPVPCGPRRTSTRSATIRPCSSTFVFAWAMT